MTNWPTTGFEELAPYHFSPTVVPPDGTGESGILVIGEAPGAREDYDGIPFHPQADAGSVLSRVLQRSGMGYSYDERGKRKTTLKLTNCVWQRPPENELADMPYEQLAIDLWKPSNQKLIDEMKPKVIMLLGNTALKTFTEFGREVNKTSILHLQNYATPGPNGVILLPGLHPSFILHGQQAHTATLIWLFGQAQRLARSGLGSQPAKYIEYPTEADFLAFERVFNPDIHTLAYDIETPESDKLTEEEVEDETEDISYQIIRISFCYDPVNGYAISCPWRDPFIAIALRLIAKAQRLTVWNAPFDNPRLEKSGAIFNGTVHDAMQQWHFIQPTLPRSLEFATPLLGWQNGPWKFKSGTNPELYSAIDAHTLSHNFHSMEKSLKSSGRWDIYEQHVVRVYEVLTKMAANGLPYDKEEAARFEIRLEALKKEREDTLQIKIPDELKNGKQACGYKKVPKHIEEHLLANPGALTFQRMEIEVEKDEETGEKIETEVLAKYEFRQFRLTLINKTLPSGKVKAEEKRAKAETLPELIIEVERWVRVKKFLPTSWQQLIKLIKFFGHQPGINRKTKNETSDDETIRKIIKKCINSKRPADHDFAATLKMCREVRQLSKVLGTYVKGWRPGADGRIHPSFGFWGKMFRISARNPNTAATIADKQEEYIASGFRKCVSTAPGKFLVEADYKGIEAVLVGHFANDADYVRLAKIGVHDYYCCHILASKGKIKSSDIPNLALSDKELKVIFKDIKKRFPKDRDDAKHCIAENELVLTNHGLVPIQNITLDHKLWDGVEWVSHEGVVDQGIREVIVHDGLTATTDHEIVTCDGRIIPFGEAASTLVGLETTGIKGKAIWTRYYNLLRTSAKQRIDRGRSDLFPMWKSQMDQLQQLDHRENFWMPGLCPPQDARNTQEIGMAVGGDDRSVSASPESCILPLWGAWDQGTFQITPGLYRMDFEKSAASDLQRGGDRSDRQRQTLCTGQSQIGDAETTEYEQMQQCLDKFREPPNSFGRLRQSLRILLDTTVSSERNDRGSNYQPCQETRPQRGMQILETASKVVRRSRVYDIVNAGPRRCFTVSNKLVLNCIHGTAYKMTPFLMADLYEMPLSEAERLQAIYFDLFPKIKLWQDAVIARADRECRLVNPWGYTMSFWEVRRLDSKAAERYRATWVRRERHEELAWYEREQVKRIQQEMSRGRISAFQAIENLSWKQGDDAKSAVSFLPRDSAAAMLKDVLLRPAISQLADAGKLLAPTHDSLLGEDTGESAAYDMGKLLYTEMTCPVSQLNNLVVDVEVAWGRTWDKEAMETMEIRP